MGSERPVWAATHVGCVRRVNEDRCLVGEWRSDGTDATWRGKLAAEQGWAVIADGMGGHAAGDVASGIAVATIASLIGEVTSPRGVEAMLDVANRDLFAAMLNGVGRLGMGTTVVGVRWSGREALAFSLGDSRAYLVGRNGLTQTSTDDILGGNGRPGHTRSHVLTQCLGGTSRPVPLHPHVRRLPLARDASLLLCSDGLSDMVEASDILKRRKGRCRG